MGSFCTGDNTVTRDQTQSYSPNAQGQGALNQAAYWIGGLNPQNAPLQGTAGLSGNQQSGIQGVANTANNNPANQWFNQANQNIQQGAQTPDAQAFLDPYNDYLLKNWKQYSADPAMRDANGRAVANAGGVGAERNALASQNAAFNQNQQLGGLLANQWNTAFGQAATAGQMKQSAGALQANAANPALQSQLGAYGAQIGAGQLEQQTAQNQYNAYYNQDYLRNISLPGNIAQMYGQLAPLYGGTQTGQQTTTYPQQSPWSQIAGPLAAGVGSYLGRQGGGRVYASGGMPGQSWTPFNFEDDAKGGDPTKPPPQKGVFSGVDLNKIATKIGSAVAGAQGGAVNPYDVGQGYADGGTPSFDDRFNAAFDPIYEEKVPVPKSNPFRDNGQEIQEEAPDSGGGMPQRSMGMPQQRGPAGLPEVPDLGAGPHTQAAQNPWAGVVRAMATAAAHGGERDQFGLIKGGPPLGQILRQAGIGVNASLDTTQEQAKTERNMAMEKYKEQMQQAPYSQLTAAQRLEALKPFKIGTDPVTFMDVYGIRDPSTGEIHRVDPNTGKIIPGGAGEAGASGAPGGGLQGEEYLAELAKTNPGLAATVKSVEEGRQAPPSINSRSPQARMILNHLYNAYPESDTTIWKSRNETRASFAKGVEGRAVTSLNTVMGHMWDLKETVDKLAGKNIKSWNAVENAIRDHLGGSALADFKVARTAVSDELARVFQGAGVAAESEKQRWLDALSSSSSPEQFKRTLGRLTSLIDSRMHALESQHDRGMAYNPDNPKSRQNIGFLDKGPRERYDKIKEWSNSPTEGEAPPVKYLKEGQNTTFRGGKGTWTLKDGKPIKVGD